MVKTKPKPKVSGRSQVALRIPKRWQLQDAKAKFSQLVRESRKAPQFITFRGEEVAVLQSIEDYRKKSRMNDKGPNLLEALLACPDGPDLVIDRDPADVVPKGPPLFG